MATNTGLSSPKPITIRPLRKGMIQNVPSADLEPGAFVRLMNLQPTEAGLQRRGGYLEQSITRFVHEIDTSANNGFYDPFRQLFNAFASAGTPEAFIIGDNFFYRIQVVQGGLELNRYGTRTPEWTLDNYLGWTPSLIEWTGGTSYNVFMPQSLFINAGITPLESDLLNLRPSRQTPAWQSGASEGLLANPPGGWGNGTSWSDTKPNSEQPFSMWVRINGVPDTETINGIAYYKFPILDNSADRLLGSWPYSTTYLSPNPNNRAFYLLEAAHEQSFAADDLHPLQWTEATRKSVAAGTPALYLAAQSWTNMRRLEPGQSTFTQVSPPAGNVTNISSVCYHRGYLFIGNFYQGSDLKRNMIRWSSPVNCESFAANDYLTLATNTELVCLVSFGQYIVAFFGDAVYMGYPSNIAGLPFRFEQLQTGGVGIVNPRAWTVWKDSLFFVGQNNVYRIGLDGALASIGDSIVPAFFYGIDFKVKLNAVQFLADIENDRLLLSAPTSSATSFTEFFSFNWKTGAWAQESIQAWAQTPPAIGTELVRPAEATGLAYAGISAAATYDSYTQTQWNDATGWEELGTGDTNRIDSQRASIDSYTVRADKNSLWLLTEKQLFRYNSGSPFCGIATAFPVWFETPDYDFDIPDIQKGVISFSMKISMGISNEGLNLSESHWTGPTPLVFRIDASRDRGGSWQPYGRLRIYPGKDEGIATQIFTGSMVRFRVVCENLFDATIVDVDGNPVTNVVERPFTVLEYSMRARIGGRETFY